MLKHLCLELIQLASVGLARECSNIHIMSQDTILHSDRLMHTGRHTHHTHAHTGTHAHMRHTHKNNNYFMSLRRLGRINPVVSVLITLMGYERTHITFVLSTVIQHRTFN